MSERKSWWVGSALLFVVLLFPAVTRAESCLTIDVPSQAVVGQYDGDTFDIFTFGSPSSVPIRVQGVDTPERKKKQPGWSEAREFTRKWLAAGPFKVTTCGERTFERIVGIVERNGETLAQALITAGHSR